MTDRVTRAAIQKVTAEDGAVSYRWTCRTFGVAVYSDMTWEEYKNCRKSLLRAFPELKTQMAERRKRWKEKGE